MLRKPDASIFAYTRKVAQEGFPSNPNDWLTKCYGSATTRKKAYSAHGVREVSAIHAALVDGLDHRVAVKAPDRPPHGLVMNVHRDDVAMQPEYTTAVLLPQMSNYHLSFIVFEHALFDTYAESLHEQLVYLAQQGETNPVVASHFVRRGQLSKLALGQKPDTLTDLELGYEGIITAYQVLRRNLEVGVKQAIAFLKIIPFVCQKYDAPKGTSLWQRYQTVAKNSLPFVVEAAFMDTRISTFAQFAWLNVLDFGDLLHKNAAYFQMSGEGEEASLDFSEEFKGEIQRLEKDLSGGRRGYGCPAARVVRRGAKSLVAKLWEWAVPVAGSLYEFYFRD